MPLILGMPLQLQQEPPWPLLLPICLLSIEAQLTSCLPPPPLPRWEPKAP